MALIKYTPGILKVANIYRFISIEIRRAMEVSGIEGSYRSTCEKTMSVLRDNKGSLVDMLEAFVHDPLISWRVSHIDFHLVT